MTKQRFIKTDSYLQNIFNVDISASDRYRGSTDEVDEVVSGEVNIRTPDKYRTSAGQVASSKQRYKLTTKGQTLAKQLIQEGQ